MNTGSQRGKNIPLMIAILIAIAAQVYVEESSVKAVAHRPDVFKSAGL
ncbi:MAG: hypothetical protein U0136_03855 [Bdellovibrionota bacterium]